MRRRFKTTTVSRGSFIRFVRGQDDPTPYPRLDQLIAKPEAACLLTALRCFGTQVQPIGNGRIRLIPPPERFIPRDMLDQVRRLEPALAALLATPNTDPAAPGNGGAAHAALEGGKHIMPYAFDPGFSQAGPWLNWHTQQSRDGQISAFSWSLRDADGRETTDLPEKGVVLDFANLKTGWELTTGVSGVAPERVWNQDRAHYEPAPVGDGWKRCFSIPVALGKNDRATWEQSGIGAMSGLTELIRAISIELDTRAPKLPVVRCDGHKPITTRGGPTSAPMFTVIDWVERPAVLDNPEPGYDGDPAPSHGEAGLEAAERELDDEQPGQPAASSEKLRDAIAHRRAATRNEDGSGSAPRRSARTSSPARGAAEAPMAAANRAGEPKGASHGF